MIMPVQKVLKVSPSIAGVVGSALAITGLLQGNVHLAYVGIGIGMASSLVLLGMAMTNR